MNPVNSEQHMYYIHLVMKEQHCSGECLHRRLCHNHLMHVPFALGLQPTHFLRCLLLPVWEDCLLSVANVYAVIYLYTSATELHTKCGFTLHIPHYRKVIPRQVAVLETIIKHSPSSPTHMAPPTAPQAPCTQSPHTTLLHSSP